ERFERMAQDVFTRFGFEPIRTPVMEEADLFRRSVGESTDIVQKEMYEFEDRGHTRIALRPEGTAGVVRAFIENHLAHESAVRKFYYYGPMFRAERPQAGRMRQFHQIGLESLGSDSVRADTEIMQALAAFLNAAGIRGAEFQINCLGDPDDRKRYAGELRSYLERRIGDICETCRIRMDANVMRVLDCKNPSCRDVVRDAPKILESVKDAYRAELEVVLGVLAESGIKGRYNPTVVRGLDYYTRIVFEVTHPDLGSQDALAAGGRYDLLVKQLGGRATPAVGCALGMERLVMAMKAAGDPASGPRIVVVALGESAQQPGYRLLSQIRAEGFDSDMDFENRSLKAQLRRAEKCGARWCLILGDNEIQKQTVIIKDMTEGGGQNEIPAGDVLGHLRKVLQ
ncbi:MAG: histidine--tRNA ligase, partial [Candidatus Omnitrophica bacterium]|nr:histidine--tRNA ligase [Candidatus Omnitrophota bacterium]